MGFHVLRGNYNEVLYILTNEGIGPDILTNAWVVNLVLIAFAWLFPLPLKIKGP